MSLILTLTSCAILAAVSLSNTALMAIAVRSEDKQEMLEPSLETRFTDCDILVRTLSGLDCHYKVIGKNEVRVETTAGELIYRRENETEAFRLFLGEINDREALVENIRSFETDYQRNVQAYTYAHIKDNLPPGMTVAEDILLDDDTLVLTINVED